MAGVCLMTTTETVIIVEVAAESGGMAELSATYRSEDSGPDEEYLSNIIIVGTKSGKSADIYPGSCDHSASDHICDPKLSATSDQGSESEGHTGWIPESGQLNSCG